MPVMSYVYSPTFPHHLWPPDASPEAWSDLVGLSPGSQLPTSFLILADPKFQQTRPLLAGLDFAFPAATKVRRQA